MKKIAIIVVDSLCFNSDIILRLNNEKRLEWLHAVDSDIPVDERNDQILVFDEVAEFVNEYNCGACHSADDFLVDIEYDSNKNIIDYVHEVYDSTEGEREVIVEETIRKANEELAECIAYLHNCMYLQDVYELVDGGCTDMYFGNEDYSNKDYIGICYKDIQFDVLCKSDGGIMIAGDRIQVFCDGVEIFCGTLNEEGVNGVESQDSANIYLKPDDPKAVKKELDGEFVDHVASILRDGVSRIIVQISGEKYIINGLFDNEDLIIDVYVAGTMKRIDRYFVIGAQDGINAEAEYYAEYFMEHIVKTDNLNDCWYLSEKQWQFLKNA